MADMRIAVIGGGISGLAAAYRLLELSKKNAQRIAVTLFESTGRLGGTIQTERIDDYLVETGPDSFITNKPAAISLCRRLGLEDQLIPTDERFRGSLVLRKGRVEPVPDGFMLLTPARIGPVIRSRIFSPWGKLRMGLEYFVPRRRTADDESLASFVRRRFGREALERLVQPLVGGIYTSDPEQLSLKATMPRFLEMEERHGSLIRAMRRNREPRETAQGARYGLFATIDSGLQTLVDRLAERIGTAGEIRLNTPVQRIAERDHAGETRWSLEFSDGTQGEFDGLILAVPAFCAAELVSTFDAELSALLNRIEYASSAVVVSGHRLEDVAHPLDSFGLVIPAIEKRRILAVSFTSRKFPGRAPEGHALLRTFVGGAMQPEEFHRTGTEILESVLAELRELLGVRREEDFALVARHDRAMPLYHVGHLDLVEQIEQRASQHAHLALAGNAFRGVGIPDCIQSGERAAEMV